MSKLRVCLRAPRVLPMVRQIRISAGYIVHQPQFSVRPQNRMLPSEANQHLPEIEYLLVLLPLAPVQPGDGIVLTIGIIIPLLGIPELISHKNQRCGLGQHQQTHGVFYLSDAKLLHSLPARPAFLPAVPAAVTVASVPVIFPIGFVMFMVIRNKVCQGKTIIIGQIMDAARLLRNMTHVIQHTAQHPPVSL